jgi:hypothetical protein
MTLLHDDAQIVAVVVSVAYNFYFDVRYDWGLLDVKSDNRLLRNKLIFPRWVHALLRLCVTHHPTA